MVYLNFFHGPALFRYKYFILPIFVLETECQILEFNINDNKIVTFFFLDEYFLLNCKKTDISREGTIFLMQHR